MKVMSRNFTRAEKVLLAILALILVALAYYWFVDQTVRDSIRNSQMEGDALQKDLTELQTRITYLESLQSTIDELQESGNMTYMGSYNNSPEEVAFLNVILADTLNYSISFANVTRSGNQIRRSFTLQYQTADYEAARDIMTRLIKGKNRCLVGDVKCSIGKDGRVSMNVSATFFETMVGGSSDAALPKDSAEVNQ